jgi:hypothetical protein
MPHFVAIPPKPSSPGLQKLALRDASGNGAVAVWAADRDWSIQLCAANNAYSPISSARFQSDSYNKDGNNFCYFMLRGLKSGDHIAAYDNAGRPQTAALPITFSSTDRPSNNLAARASVHSARLILNPAGAEQADLKTTGQEWVDTVERVIKYMLANPMGRLIVNSLTSNVNIFPYLRPDEQAWSNILFSPRNWEKNMMAGSRPNEVLFHELCHVAESAPTPYLNVQDTVDHINFVYSGTDFFSVTATNVYTSIVHRPLRKDHAGAYTMPWKYGNLSDGAAKFRALSLPNFNIFSGNNTALNNSIAAISAPWNPF